MNPYKQIARAFIIAAFIMVILNHCQAQLVVNGKNINAEKDVEYIQLMYYIDKSTFGPVFFIDFGYIEPEYTDIIEPERDRLQRITINGEDVTDRITAVWILNQLNKAGWEYMGDAVYVPLRIMHNWHILTLKRK
jgi:hypothetical protein